MRPRYRQTRRALQYMSAALLALGCLDDAPLGLTEWRELTAAERRWAARNFADYVFEMRVGCFCSAELNEWAVVEVRGGQITAVRRLTGEEVPPAEWSGRLTVEGMFAQLRTYRPDWLSDVDARFDETLGYPIQASFASKPDFLDAGLTYYARNVRPLE